MSIHSDALARVLARLEQTLVQGFSRSFLRACKGCKPFVQPCLTYMCACASVHARWITSNPCNSCNPCFPFFRMAVLRHSSSTDRARVTQGCGYSCKGVACRGGCESQEGRRPLDRYRSHAGIFSLLSGFLGGVGAAGRLMPSASGIKASKVPAPRSAAHWPSSSSHKHAGGRGNAMPPVPAPAAINFLCVETAR
jgi:hypothetical protein